MTTPHAWLGSVAAELGTSRGSLLALSRTNDPWNTGTPAHIRDGEWLANAWEAHVETTSHLRRLHYRLMTEERIRPNGEPYLNTDSCWAWLVAASRIARDLGLIDTATVTDRRNREIVFNTGSASGVPTPFVSLPEPSIEVLTIDDVALDVPQAVVRGYKVRPEDEPYRLCVVAEKSTVDDVLDPLCESLHVDYIAGTGFASHTRIGELAIADDRPLRILYVSDHDDAGRTMPIAFARRLEFLAWKGELGERDIALEPVVLTQEQIAQYDLPRSPDKGNTELDALESLHPGVLRQIVQRAVHDWRDRTFARRMDEARAEAREMVGEIMDPISAELAPLTERINAVLGTAQVTYLDAIQAIEAGEDMQELRRLVMQASEAIDELRLPERPTPEVEDLAGAWLYLLRRDYIEQLGYYRNGRKQETGEL